MTFQYPVDKLILSHSSRSTFRRCARQFEFSKMFGEGSKNDEMFAADVGKSLHEGFQEYLISRDEEKAILKFLIHYPHHLEFMRPEYHYNRSLEACYITLMELINSPMADRYELIHIKTQLEGNPVLPAIEVPFALEIINSPMPIPVWFVGFIDAILYDKQEDIYIVNDIKTTRINVNDMSPRYEFDEQTVPYGIILEQMLGRKIEHFKVSYLSAYIDLMEPKVSMYQFIKTEDHIQDWYTGLCEDIGRIANYYKKQSFRRTTNGETCFSFNRPCFFAEFCSIREAETIAKLTGGEVRKGLFHDDQKPWVTAQLEWQEG
jgi:hypothetical protein